MQDSFHNISFFVILTVIFTIQMQEMCILCKKSNKPFVNFAIFLANIERNSSVFFLSFIQFIQILPP